MSRREAKSECERPENNVKTKIINCLKVGVFGRDTSFVLNSQKCNWDDGCFLGVTVVHGKQSKTL